ILGAVGATDIDAESERDRSAHGAEHAARCRAALPDPAAKARAWQSIITDVSLSNRLVVALASGFWQPEQDGLTDAYVPRYFEDMPAVAERRTADVARRLAEAAYPRDAVNPETARTAQPPPRPRRPPGGPRPPRPDR